MNKTQQIFVVIGGGAAGFFTAVNAAAANPDLHVILIEKTTKLLSKVAVSGGGRCNVTHACFDNAQLVKYYPRGAQFLKKAFTHFAAKDTVSWFESRGVQLKQESDGRMFPVTDDAQSIVRILLNEASQYGIDIMMNAAVVGIAKINQAHHQGPRFEIQLKNEKKILAHHLCVACGGLSHASFGQWVQDLGHQMVKPVPSLFTFNLSDKKITSLMGVTVTNTEVRIAQTKLRQSGPLLITHWGFSGPAILKISAWGAVELESLNYDFKGYVNWIPTYDEHGLFNEMPNIRKQMASVKMNNRNPFGLPSRLWEYLLQTVEIDPEIRWADLPAKKQHMLVKQLCSYEFHVKGKTTFKEEFVTAGGIELSEVNPHTMESRITEGLYFAGEVLNVDGVTGGFNFQNAWTSGWIAAQAVAASGWGHTEND